MSPCFPWDPVAPSAFVIPAGHLCQRAIWGDSGFGVQDMCFWYLFGHPSWWSLGIVLLQPFFSWLGIRQRRGKKWSTAVSNIKRSQMGLGFCFPGSSSRLIHLSIVRMNHRSCEDQVFLWFFEAHLIISLTCYGYLSCMSLLITRSLGHLYATMGNVTHVQVRAWHIFAEPVLLASLKPLLLPQHASHVMWDTSRRTMAEGWRLRVEE